MMLPQHGEGAEASICAVEGGAVREKDVPPRIGDLVLGEVDALKCFEAGHTHHFSRCRS